MEKQHWLAKENIALTVALLRNSFSIRFIACFRLYLQFATRQKHNVSSQLCLKVLGQMFEGTAWVFGRSKLCFVLKRFAFCCLFRSSNVRRFLPGGRALSTRIACSYNELPRTEIMYNSCLHGLMGFVLSRNCDFHAIATEPLNHMFFVRTAACFCNCLAPIGDCSSTAALILDTCEEDCAFTRIFWGKERESWPSGTNATWSRHLVAILSEKSAGISRIHPFSTDLLSKSIITVADSVQALHCIAEPGVQSEPGRTRIALLSRASLTVIANFKIAIVSPPCK